MRSLGFVAGVVLIAGCANQEPKDVLQNSAAEAPALKYPAVPRGEQVDTYHGTAVADPYRWLEELDAQPTRDWIAAQNALTDGFLAKLPVREKLKARMTELWNFDSYGVPFKEGGRYFFTQRVGLQNQPVLYWAPALDQTPKVLFDPNTLAADGTEAVSQYSVSRDGRHLAYAVQSGGSDWQTWRVRNVDSASDLGDAVQWSKFSGASWAADGSGFYYSAYDPPAEGQDKLKASNENQKVYFHRLNTAQTADVLFYARPDQPQWGFRATVSDDGGYLILNVSQGTDERNRLFYKELSKVGSGALALIPDLIAAFTYVGNEGRTFWFLSDWNAPRYQLIAIDLDRPEPEHWRVLVPEGQSTLQSVNVINDQFHAIYLTQARSEIRRFSLDGTPLASVVLSGLGTVAGLTGHRSDKESFYSLVSYTAPASIYRYLPEPNQSQLYRLPQTPFQSDFYVTEQVRYRSKDGTMIPMFITHHRDMQKNGANPTLLYGYGGFNISILPTYSPAVATWLDMGGVYAVANLRGGGEFGREWHEAGMKLKKQNVFDDFAAAAEYLIAERISSPKHIAITGRSNGGLLAAAVAMQRPELFAASVPAVGVLDMLRFREFTIGRAWESDYGSVQNADEFKVLYGYSPLHNIRAAVDYPPMLVLTADHDDRVFPAHSFKFTAEMQHSYRGSHPQLIRIESRGGHGAGKPTAMLIEENADWMAFVAYFTGLEKP